MRKDLNNIIINFAKKGLVFSNEYDFQFALGNEIKKLNYVKDVYFEVVSFDSNVRGQINNRVNKLSDARKEYTDLMIERNDGTYTAIELKYKTCNRVGYYISNFGNFITLSQGAYDIGAYNFIKDIGRLENINNRYFPIINKNISQCFAIMLTNDKNYSTNNFSRSKIWGNYSLAKGSIGPGYLRFNNTPDPYKYEPKSTAYKAIDLKQKYDFVWEKYPLKYSGNGPQFNYLIVQVK